MKKKMTSHIIAILAIVVFALLGIASATTPGVEITYTEPAKVNMSGIKRIAIESNNAHVTNTASQRITATGLYTLGTAAEVAEWRTWSALADRQRKAAEITAVNLARAYGENVPRADSNYGNGKTLRVTGVVGEIDVLRNRYYVRLTGSGNDSIMVFFASSEMDKVRALNRNQTITIVGECHGRSIPDDPDIAEILRLLGAGQRVNIVNANFLVPNNYSGALDAVIIFNTTASIKDNSRTQQQAVAVGKDSDGKTIYRNQNVTSYQRTANVQLNYQVWNTRSISIIGQGGKTSYHETPFTIYDGGTSPPTNDQMTVTALNKGSLSEAIGEIIPMQRTLKITLAKETENKTAQKEMSAAEKLVKSKDYEGAVAAYSEIYTTHKNFAAGYNQAVITEAIPSKGTVEALKLMEALFKETNDPMAQTALSDMQRRNEANQRAASQLSR